MSESALVAGIDLGTSSCKVGLFDAAGQLHGFGRAAYAIARGPGGLAEQRADDWWQAVAVAVRQALQVWPVSADRVAAVGLSGQVGTHVLIDEAAEPIRPA